MTDEDFSKPTRNVELPALPKNIDDAIGANGKPVIIKKNVFEKNWRNHKFPFDESRKILKSALYNTDLVGQTQPTKKPLHWVAIKLDDKSPIVILEVNDRKDNTEIVGWYTLDERNLERIKRQANKDGGELIVLSPKDKVVSLPTPLTDLPSAGKVTEKENSVQTSIANAEAETDTDPSEAQKKAGNYKKGHVKIDGFDVTIENPKGSVRRGTDADGKQWEQEMHNTYGYILGTEGVDGDHIDVFLSDNPANGDVFVVDQVNKDGTFDEHKVMYGFASEEEARKAYLSNYEDGWTGIGAITRVSKEEFKKWVDSSHRKTKPFAEYKGVKKTDIPGETDIPGSNAGKMQKADDVKPVTKQEAAMRDALVDVLRGAGVEVFTGAEELQLVLDEANDEVKMQAKKRALETASLSESSERSLTVVSSAAGERYLKVLTRQYKTWKVHRHSRKHLSETLQIVLVQNVTTARASMPRLRQRTAM